MVCFSLVDKDTLNNIATQWIPELEQHCPKTPVILVGTQADIRDDPDFETKHECFKYEKVDLGDAISIMDAMNASSGNKCFKVLECSAKTGAGLKDVFDEIGKVGLIARKKRE